VFEGNGLAIMMQVQNLKCKVFGTLGRRKEGSMHFVKSKTFHDIKTKLTKKPPVRPVGPVVSV